MSYNNRRRYILKNSPTKMPEPVKCKKCGKDTRNKTEVCTTCELNFAEEFEQLRSDYEIWRHT